MTGRMQVMSARKFSLDFALFLRNAVSGGSRPAENRCGENLLAARAATSGGDPLTLLHFRPCTAHFRRGNGDRNL
jgi:hypothetical protein